MTARAGLRATLLLSLASLACNGTNLGDAGCQATAQVQLPFTPLTSMPDARLLAADTGFVLIGSDGMVVRWATVGFDGVLGTEHLFQLPTGAVSPIFALAGGPGTSLDTVLVGFLLDAPNGADSELHFISAPLDGSPPSTAAAAALTFPGGVEASPTLAIATPKPRAATSPQQAMNAGVTWVDSTQGVMLAFIDGHGALAGGPTLVEETQPLGCLDITGDTIDPDASFLVSFMRSGAMTDTPSWEEGEVRFDGNVATLTATVAEAGRAMGCSVGTPTSGFDYAFAWQDSSGSWLSVFTGRMSDGMGNVSPGTVQSYPFVAATDFGGPDVQPPIAGLAAIGGGTVPFAGDYAVLFGRTHGPEMWRLTFDGNRRTGALVLPLTRQYWGGLRSVNLPGSMAITYLDYSGDPPSSTTQSRWLVNASCY